MELIQALWLGILQGLTEFLPVSSSGHLTLLSEMFKIDLSGDLVEVYIVLLHLGTLIAVMLCYWKRIWIMIKHPIKSELKWLVLATVPTVVYALLPIEIDAYERMLLPWCFLFTAAILYLSDYISRVRKINESSHKDVRWYDALTMGMMQIIGTLPGVSRSGSTLAGGLTTGLTRKRAADFSFLMSIPAVCGAAVLDAYDLYKAGSFGVLAEIGTKQIGLGILTAALCGVLAIKLMLLIVKKISLKWFSLYTGILGVSLLVNDFFFHWW